MGKNYDFIPLLQVKNSFIINLITKQFKWFITKKKKKKKHKLDLVKIRLIVTTRLRG